MRCFGLTAALALLITAGTPLAATPEGKCTAAKVKAAGLKVYAKTKCFQKAVQSGGSVDLSCLGKAEAKFLATFSKIDAAGGCLVTGNAAAIEAQVDACLTTFTGAITGNAKCAAAKLQAVGKNTYAKAKCGHGSPSVQTIGLSTKDTDWLRSPVRVSRHFDAYT